MAHCPHSFRFLKRLNVPVTQAERQSVERVLGVARFGLAVLCLVAVYMDPTDPSAYRFWAQLLLILWMLYSGGILALLRSKNASPQMVWVLACHRLSVAAFIMLLTEGPHSPFFGLLFVALIGAGFRWGFPEALVTAGAGIALLTFEAVMIKGGGWQFYRLIQGDFEFNRLILRCAYLLSVGFFSGYLAEIARSGEPRVISSTECFPRYARTVAWERVCRRPSTNTCASTMPRKYFVLKNLAEDRMFVWQLSPSSPMANLYHRELSSRNCADYLLSSEPDTYLLAIAGI